MFISNDCASFHLWRKKNLVKHQDVSKYFKMIVAFTKGQKQLTAKEVETTRQTATVRVHIERIIAEI